MIVLDTNVVSEAMMPVEPEALCSWGRLKSQQSAMLQFSVK